MICTRLIFSSFLRYRSFLRILKVSHLRATSEAYKVQENLCDAN